MKPHAKTPSHVNALKPADQVSTAAVVAVGLIGGWLTARETGMRPLGGVLFGAAGLWAARSWHARGGPAAAGLLGAGYLAAFGLSHPLAKKIGPWPAVLVVSNTMAGATALVSDRASRVR
ncbi:hypothetical protein [Devriesea agamarum]|uniref:hypothetical protein n=1 Tax=Devriesea agamarum TaxID=472569 RepID=UPI00071C8227|nr:hypothetical protein [Devriesea agamarum]